ncbi:MAG: DUF302 domain-containing protein [Candidatus Dormibacteraeota bacterium]|nr:DUF302 domain-containing protein [Candidatus Dormibacteraeota bacterium]
MRGEDYAFSVSVQLAIPEAEEAVRRELAAEGFGVLTEIDVRATLREKLDLDFRPYRILGACNPDLAHRALRADPRVGVLLPCNVVLEEERAGSTRVLFMEPRAIMTGEDAELEAVSGEASEKLHRVAARLSASAS